MLGTQSAPQLLTPFHEQLAELIPPLAPTHAPEAVAPGVAFDEPGIPGRQQPRRQFCTRRELARQQAAHDLNAQVVPARSQYHLSPESLGVTRSRCQADELPLSGIQRLGRGERVLDGRVDRLSEGKTS